jgi:hypothetical protein
MNDKTLAIYFLAIPLLLASRAALADPGKTIMAAELKQEPFIDASTVSKLEANTELDVLKRQGGWMQVKAPAGEGWLKMTSIRLGAATAAKGDSGLGSLAKMALTGRSGNTGVTATTGVRGLSPEELKNARPDPAAVKQLDQYATNKSKAQSFASTGKLQAQPVEYLDTIVASKAGGQ